MKALPARCKGENVMTLLIKTLAAVGAGTVLATSAFAQSRVENVRILPVFGAAAVNVSPRLGHLHITVDDLPWLWADASDLSAIDVAGMPPGTHKVLIELVDPNHEVFKDCATCRQTVTFIVPRPGEMSHEGGATK